MVVMGTVEHWYTHGTALSIYDVENICIFIESTAEKQTHMYNCIHRHIY